MRLAFLFLGLLQIPGHRLCPYPSNDVLLPNTNPVQFKSTYDYEDSLPLVEVQLFGTDINGSGLVYPRAEGLCSTLRVRVRAYNLTILIL